MRKFLLLLTFFVAGMSFVSAQYIWTAAGDGTSWDDPANWNQNEVPRADSLVVISQSDTITGTAPNIVASVRINAMRNVVLDLDLTIGNGVSPEHAITFGDTSSLILGLPGNNRTFTLNPPDDKQGVAIFGGSDAIRLTVSETSTLNLMSGNAGINLANAMSTVLNGGTINAQSGLNDGFRVGGSFRNEGTINGGPLNRDLFNVKLAGVLVNAEQGTINSDQPGDDGVEIVDGAVFRNEGTLQLTAKDDAGSGNACIAVGSNDSEGTFINESENVSLDGGGGTGDLSGRALAVETMGSLSNSGVITISGGAANNRLFVKGMATNGLNGTIDLTDGRFNVNASGTFTNNGLMKSTRDGSGGFAAGIATNNAFFDYENSNQFSSGANGTIVDKGFSLNNNDVRVNARNNCEIDLVNAPYEWFIDGVSYAMASDTGLFAFADNSLAEDSILFTTTIPGVEIKVINICDEAVRPNSVFGIQQQVKNISIYPNPVNQGQSIYLDLSDLAVRAYPIAIYNSQGMLLRRVSVTGGQTASIPSEELPRGVYYLRMEHDGELMSGTFMVR